MKLTQIPLFPDLPYEKWVNTKTTLHLYTQIAGKIRLKLHPYKNHWWHVTLYPTPYGLTTGPIPYGNGCFSINFDFIQHVLTIHTLLGIQQTISLKQKNIATFYAEIFSTLNQLGIQVNINPRPFDPERVGSDIPYDIDTKHGDYQEQYVYNFQTILSQIYPIFAHLNSKFYGKCTPIHFFWHSFDFVLTFFSGKTGPDVSQMDSVSSSAYSHEVISFGFWPGDNKVTFPAFYSYTYPEPKALKHTILQPSDEALWNAANGSHIAILSYDAMRKSKKPNDTLLEFFTSAFLNGAQLANWDHKQLWQ